ncbi:hypothetical protein GF324_07650 [bacterium]|nr:hypothetical protein [bacterium]
MEDPLFQITRYVLAGVNGLLFVVGGYIILLVLKIRPDRWRRRLAELIAEESRDLPEPSENGEEPEPDKEQLKRHVEMQELQRLLRSWRSDPAVLMNAGFGILMVLVSLFALFNLLLSPSWALF